MKIVRIILIIAIMMITAPRSTPNSTSVLAKEPTCACNFFEIKKDAGGCPEITNGEKPNLVIYEAYGKFSCEDCNTCQSPNGEVIPCEQCSYGYGDTGEGRISSGAAGTDCTAAETAEEFIRD